MIFILHYILFNAALPPIIILITLFLQTYTNASLTEIGALLMALPFLSVFIKPLFCVLADRQQAHKQYLIGSLLLMGLGYGSLAVAPFFPDFVKTEGRLIWYLDIVAIIVGYSAFGVVWSMGDALAVNLARKLNVPWGSYRVWGTVSWGVFGLIIGQINETPLLPKYVPAFFLLIVAILIEVCLLSFWPKRDFVMADEEDQTQHQQLQLQQATSTDQGRPAPDDAESAWPAGRPLGGTLGGSARVNPRLVGALANIVMEDIGSTLKSSLRLGQQPKRAGLAEILEQHRMSGTALGSNGIALAPATPPSPAPGAPPTPPAAESGVSRAATLGKAALRRTQLAMSRMNSLSAASGHAIADELRESAGAATPTGQAPPAGAAAAMLMSSLASQTSLSRAAAARAFAFGSGASTLKESSGGSLVYKEASAGQLPAAVELQAPTKLAKSPEANAEDLQLVLLKLIMKRDSSVLKFLVMFTLFGILMTIHITYFFLHVEQLCREKGYDFSHVTGLMFVAHSVSEILSFMLIVPYFVPKVGRLGALITCAFVYAIRYTYYGTYYIQYSPYSALITEGCHGIAYGITYSLITDIATECVNQVDIYLPELIHRQIVSADINPAQLKLPLRATMQGVFSGAFDGLGNGIGALVAGIYLDYNSFVDLWLLCAYISFAIMIIYPLTEWRTILKAHRSPKQQQQQQQVK